MSRPSLSLRWLAPALAFGLVLTCAWRADATIPATQRAYLQALYTSTNGASWTQKQNWNGAVGTECTWYGVLCDKPETTVTGLALGNNNLTGPLPANITDLPNLVTLDFFTGHLSGSVPSLTGLTSLAVATFDDNQLTGSIPSLAGLTTLVSTSYSGNSLTGSIPSLAGLTNLQYFDVSFNQLTGTIPTLTGLTSLNFFGAAVNQLTGTIPSLTGLSNLAAFSVEVNQLSGSLPALTGLASLQVFRANQNQLSGPIPSLAGLTNLQNLTLRDNFLTGSLPSFAGLTNLQAVYVGANQLSGSIPSFAGLSSLLVFSAPSNQLTGSLPSLQAAPMIQAFLVNDNMLSGTIPPLAGLSSLQQLLLSNNRLTGAIPPVTGLSSIVQFWVDSNGLIGPLDPSFATLTTLTPAAGLNLNFNGLFTSDATLAAFVNSKQIGGADFRATQTIAPTNIATSPGPPGGFVVTFTPIAFVTTPGYYQAFISTSAGGPFVPYATVTATKSATSLTVTGLLPATTYYVYLRTTSPPHPFNVNSITSGATPIVAAVTTSTGLSFYPLSPCRAVDTRNPNASLGGPVLGASSTRVFPLNGTCGVPAAAVAISVNVTVTQPGASGQLNLFRSDAPAPATSILNFGPGLTRANNAIVSVSADGTSSFAVENGSPATVHVIVDVNGYFR